MAKTEQPKTLAALKLALAHCEATAGGLRNKIAKLEAAEAGQPAPPCGLDLLWAAALPMSRQRSSKHRCRVAWSRLPKAEVPTIAEAVAALKAWNRSDGWRSSDHLYAPGLHRFISERMWESLPENSKADPLARYRCAATPAPTQDDVEAVTNAADIRALLGLKPLPVPSAP